MRIQSAVLAFTLLLTAVARLSAADEPKPIVGIGPVGEIVKLHSGFKFTEGPAADAQGSLYFTDIPNNRIHHVDLDGKLATFLEDSAACNGLKVDPKGRLIACQGKNKRLIAIDAATKTITVLADKCEGKPLGTPNDLIVDRNGGVYFTSPDVKTVWYVSAQGKVNHVVDDLPRPNGIMLTANEKTLYVVLSGSADVMAYPVESPGVIGKGSVFCTLEQDSNGPDRLGGDGLALDTRGNLYLANPSLKSIQVVDAKGKTLGLIRLPEEPSNCAFGGKDRTTLYVTAQTSLYAVKTTAIGQRSPVPLVESPLAEKWDYVAPMKKVAARFKGNEGMVLHIGASDTIANPYTTWARSGKGKTPEDEAVLKWMHTGANNKTDGWWLCRMEIKSHSAYTAESGMESSWFFKGSDLGLPTLAKMLETYKPQIVVIEVGIYEIEKKSPLEDYRKNMGKALDMIMEQGAIPIPTTSSPVKAQLETTKLYNDALRELAKERGLPLIDMEQEIVLRRPDDWYGTLMSRMHLTGGRNGANPGSAPTVDNLRESGFLLRAWLTVRKLGEVKRRVLDSK